MIDVKAYGNRYDRYLELGSIEGLENKDIGVIHDKVEDKPVAFIVIANEFLKKYPNSECIMSMGNSKYPNAIYITTAMAKRLQAEDNTAWYDIWHQIAHIIFKSVENYRSFADCLQARKKAVKKNTAIKELLLADAFGAEMVGKEDALQAMRKIQKKNYKLAVEHAKDRTGCFYALMFYEFRNRIRAMENDWK